MPNLRMFTLALIAIVLNVHFVSAADEIPAKVDLRPELKKYDLRPRSQGRRNTCSVFTTAAAMEFAISKETGKSAIVSPEYLNWATNRIIDNRTQDRGQFFHHLIKAYEKYGACLEEQMPYQAKFDPQLIPLPPAREKAREIAAMNIQFHWITSISRTQGLSEEKFQEVKKSSPAVIRSRPVRIIAAC